MPSVKELLSLREKVKSRKPDFVNCESWRYKRVKEHWRKPKGIDNRMRKSEKGWPKRVKIGYGSPRLARYLHPSGYRDILVHNLEELSKINRKTDAVRIASTIGKRKRTEMVKKAREMNLKILNP